jgi:hypothetical protein
MDDLVARPLSFSSIKHILKSPRHFLSYRNKPTESTKAQSFGNLFEELYLNQMLDEDFFIVEPEVDRRTTDGKKKYAEFLESCGDKIIISNGDFKLAKAIIESAKEQCLELKNPDNDFRNGKRQSCHRFSYRGYPFIAYIDVETDSYNHEIKTAESTEPAKLSRDFVNYLYPLQAALYNISNGKPILYHVFEKSEPYNSNILPPSKDFMTYGKMLLDRAVDKFDSAMQSGAFEQVGYDITDIDIPYWLRREVEMQEDY